MGYALPLMGGVDGVLHVYILYMGLEMATSPCNDGAANGDFAVYILYMGLQLATSSCNDGCCEWRLRRVYTVYGASNGDFAV